MVNFNLIDDSQDLKIELLDDNNEIEFSMTDYDDTEVRELIEEIDTKKADKTQVNQLSNQVSTNTNDISQNKDDISTLNTKVDNIHVPTKTSQLTNDSGFITSAYHDNTKQDKLVSGQNIKTINNQSVLGSGNIQIEGVTNYPELNNLPQVNGVTLTGNKTSGDLGIQPQGNYALASDIPTQLSQLTEDTTHRVVTDAEKQTWNSKSDFSGAYNDTTGKPAITHTVATVDSRNVTLSTVNTTVENTQPILNYGAFNFIPLDMSSYTSGAANKALLPETHLPAGVYIVTVPGYMRLGKETKQLDVGAIIYWRGIEAGGELDIIGYNACEYWGYDSKNNEWSGGYFTTQNDVEYIVAEKIGWAINNSTLVAGTATMTDGRWSRRTRPTGINSLTIIFPNELPDFNYKSKLTCKTSSTFTTFKITNKGYDIYFTGDDCVDGVLTGLPNKYYEIEAKHDGFEGLLVKVYSRALPTT